MVEYGAYTLLIGKCSKVPWLLLVSQHTCTPHKKNQAFFSPSVCPSGFPRSFLKEKVCLCGPSLLYRSISSHVLTPPFFHPAQLHGDFSCIFSHTGDLPVFYENCFTYRCIVDIFVGGGKFHFLLYHHLDSPLDGHFFNLLLRIFVLMSICVFFFLCLCLILVSWYAGLIKWVLKWDYILSLSILSIFIKIGQVMDPKLFQVFEIIFII